MAAVLACGPDAALSHGSAAALWRILPRWHTPTEVTAPTKRGHPGIHVHRSRRADATTHYGIRVTTPARTLVDLADVLNPKQLTRALNEAQVHRLVTAAELTTLLTRYPGRRTSQLTPERGATRSTSRTTSSASSNATATRNQLAGEVDAVHRLKTRSRHELRKTAATRLQANRITQTRAPLDPSGTVAPRAA